MGIFENECLPTLNEITCRSSKVTYRQKVIHWMNRYCLFVYKHSWTFFAFWCIICLIKLFTSNKLFVISILKETYIIRGSIALWQTSCLPKQVNPMFIQHKQINRRPAVQRKWVFSGISYPRKLLTAMALLLSINKITSTFHFKLIVKCIVLTTILRFRFDNIVQLLIWPLLCFVKFRSFQATAKADVSIYSCLEKLHRGADVIGKQRWNKPLW